MCSLKRAESCRRKKAFQNRVWLEAPDVQYQGLLTEQVRIVSPYLILGLCIYGDIEVRCSWLVR